MTSSLYINARLHAVRFLGRTTNQTSRKNMRVFYENLASIDMTRLQLSQTEAQICTLQMAFLSTLR